MQYSLECTVHSSLVPRPGVILETTRPGNEAKCTAVMINWEFVFLRGAFVGEVTGLVELIDSLQFLSLQTLGRKLSPASETQVLLVASKTTPAILGTLNSLFSIPRVQESTLAPVVLSLLFLLVLRLQQSYRRCLLPLLDPRFPRR